MMVALNRNTNQIDLRKKYGETKRRLLILEYDGVLVPYQRHPDLTVPSPELKSALGRLAHDPRNTLLLISGRDMTHLDKHWNDLPLIVAAENGAFYRVPSGTWQSLFQANNDWIDRVATAINSLSFQYSGSFVERKNHSLVWNYRNIQDPLPNAELQQIISAVKALGHSGHFTVKSNDRSIELSTKGIDAGSFVARWIGSQTFDFILAMGTSISEESLFPLLTLRAFTIRVGSYTDSRANYHIVGQEDCIQFLSDLARSQSIPILSSDKAQRSR